MKWGFLHLIVWIWFVENAQIYISALKSTWRRISQQTMFLQYLSIKMIKMAHWNYSYSYNYAIFKAKKEIYLSVFVSFF